MPPPTYKGEDKHSCTQLSVAWLVDCIEHQGLRVPHSVLSQNLLLNAMGFIPHDNTILLREHLREYVHMVGDPLLVHFPEEVDLSQYIRRGPWEEERGSHGDPDQAGDGTVVTLE